VPGIRRLRKNEFPKERSTAADARRIGSLATYRPLRGSELPTALEMLGNQVKYHQGKGETIRAKKVQVEIGKPKVIRIDVAAAQESGSAMAM
jgi:hypothetical protein